MKKLLYFILLLPSVLCAGFRTDYLPVAQGVFTSTDNATTALQVWAKQGQTANLVQVSTATGIVPDDTNTLSVTPQADVNIPYLKGIYWYKANGGQPKILNSGNGSLQIWSNPGLGVPAFDITTTGNITMKCATNTGDENPANAGLQFNTTPAFGASSGRPYLFSFGHDSRYIFGVRNNGTWTYLSTNTATGTIPTPIFEMVPSLIDESHAQGQMVFNTCHGGFGATVDEQAIWMKSDGARSIIAIGSGTVVANTITTLYTSSGTYKGLVIQSTVTQSANVLEFQDNAASSGTVVTADLAILPFPKTKAQLQVFTPKSAGEIFYCTDCTVDDIVVSTGTVAGSFARMGARTTAIQ